MQLYLKYRRMKDGARKAVTEADELQFRCSGLLASFPGDRISIPGRDRPTS